MPAASGLERESLREALLRINEWESQFAYECRLRLLELPCLGDVWVFVAKLGCAIFFCLLTPQWNYPEYTCIESSIEIRSRIL
ncbi:hypothetical protein CEXT_79221 [Caerostris extrusa]|uniref:Uncharacterized protein n=1 Tax=Caerostris extrusa TaxID=172846 RepID=A0AAV4W9N9_CAEEX|nr:hypothetical protein CEXT_79221 [Caerostris extrusa]